MSLSAEQHVNMLRDIAGAEIAAMLADDVKMQHGVHRAAQMGIVPQGFGGQEASGPSGIAQGGVAQNSSDLGIQ